MSSPLNQYRYGHRTKYSFGADGIPYPDPLEIPKIADKIIDKITQNKLTKVIDSKIGKFEVGPILGGKPFTMETIFPYTTVVGPSHPWGQTKVGTIIPDGFVNIRK